MHDFITPQQRLNDTNNNSSQSTIDKGYKS